MLIIFLLFLHWATLQSCLQIIVSCCVFYVYTSGLGLAWASFHRYTWCGLHCQVCVPRLQLVCVCVFVCPSVHPSVSGGDKRPRHFVCVSVCVRVSVYLCTPHNLSGMSSLLVSWPVVEREGRTNLMINHRLHRSRLMLSNCRAPSRPLVHLSHEMNSCSLETM